MPPAATSDLTKPFRAFEAVLVPKAILNTF